MKRQAVTRLIKKSQGANPYHSTEFLAMEKSLQAMFGDGTPMEKELLRVICSGGKRLRPILALLGYRLGGQERRDIVALMCILELMHTASLIHDDVVDGAAQRRGVPTINSTCGDDYATRCGDYLLGKAMGLLSVYKGTGINEELSGAAELMSLGELKGLSIRYKTAEQTRETYMLQIYRKTAAILAASCFTGALASGMETEKAKALRRYGENLGMAFQLCDDLADFCEDAKTGKRPGQDLKNGVYTLPVISLLENGVSPQIVSLLEKRDKTQAELDSLLKFVRDTKSLSETGALIRQKVSEAASALDVFPDCPEKTALTDLATALTKGVL